MAAGARINQLSVPFVRLALGCQPQGDLLPRAGTRIRESASHQLVKCGLIKRAASRLVGRRFIRMQAKGGELSQD